MVDGRKDRQRDGQLAVQRDMAKLWKPAKSLAVQTLYRPLHNAQKTQIKRHWSWTLVHFSFLHFLLYISFLFTLFLFTRFLFQLLLFNIFLFTVFLFTLFLLTLFLYNILLFTVLLFILFLLTLFLLNILLFKVLLFTLFILIIAHCYYLPFYSVPFYSFPSYTVPFYRACSETVYYFFLHFVSQHLPVCSFLQSLFWNNKRCVSFYTLEQLTVCSFSDVLFRDS